MYLLPWRCRPAIFGVNLKRGFPFVCAMVGSGIAAVVCVAGTTANAIGVGGFPVSCPSASVHGILCSLRAGDCICSPIHIDRGRGKRSAYFGSSCKWTAELAEVPRPQAQAQRQVQRLWCCVKKKRAGRTGQCIGKINHIFVRNLYSPGRSGRRRFSAPVYLGDSMAIIPESGTLYAPAECRVLRL